MDSKLLLVILLALVATIRCQQTDKQYCDDMWNRVPVAADKRARRISVVKCSAAAVVQQGENDNTLTFDLPSQCLKDPSKGIRIDLVAGNVDGYCRYLATSTFLDGNVPGDSKLVHKFYVVDDTNKYACDLTPGKEIEGTKFLLQATAGKCPSFKFATRANVAARLAAVKGTLLEQGTFKSRDEVNAAYNEFTEFV